LINTRIKVFFCYSVTKKIIKDISCKIKIGTRITSHKGVPLIESSFGEIVRLHSIVRSLIQVEAITGVFVSGNFDRPIGFGC
jgi:hypothetical protein